MEDLRNSKLEKFHLAKLILDSNHNFSNIKLVELKISHDPISCSELFHKLTNFLQIIEIKNSKVKGIFPFNDKLMKVLISKRRKLSTVFKNWLKSEISVEEKEKSINLFIENVNKKLDISYGKEEISYSNIFFIKAIVPSNTNYTVINGKIHNFYDGKNHFESNYITSEILLKSSKSNIGIGNIDFGIIENSNFHSIFFLDPSLKNYDLKTKIQLQFYNIDKPEYSKHKETPELFEFDIIFNFSDILEEKLKLNLDLCSLMDFEIITRGGEDGNFVEFLIIYLKFKNKIGFCNFSRLLSSGYFAKNGNFLSTSLFISDFLESSLSNDEINYFFNNFSLKIELPRDKAFNDLKLTLENISKFFEIKRIKIEEDLKFADNCLITQEIQHLEEEFRFSLSSLISKGFIDIMNWNKENIEILYFYYKKSENNFCVSANQLFHLSQNCSFQDFKSFLNVFISLYENNKQCEINDENENIKGERIDIRHYKLHPSYISASSYISVSKYSLSPNPKESKELAKLAIVEILEDNEKEMSKSLKFCKHFLLGKYKEFRIESKEYTFLGSPKEFLKQNQFFIIEKGKKEFKVSNLKKTMQISDFSVKFQKKSSKEEEDWASEPEKERIALLGEEIWNFLLKGQRILEIPILLIEVKIKKEKFKLYKSNPMNSKEILFFTENEKIKELSITRIFYFKPGCISLFLMNVLKTFGIEHSELLKLYEIGLQIMRKDRNRVFKEVPLQDSVILNVFYSSTIPQNCCFINSEIFSGQSLKGKKFLVFSNTENLCSFRGFKIRDYYEFQLQDSEYSEFSNFILLNESDKEDFISDYTLTLCWNEKIIPKSFLEKKYCSDLSKFSNFEYTKAKINNNFDDFLHSMHSDFLKNCLENFALSLSDLCFEGMLNQDCMKAMKYLFLLHNTDKPLCINESLLRKFNFDEMVPKNSLFTLAPNKRSLRKDVLELETHYIESTKYFKGESPKIDFNEKMLKENTENSLYDACFFFLKANCEISKAFSLPKGISHFSSNHRKAYMFLDSQLSDFKENYDESFISAIYAVSIYWISENSKLFKPVFLASSDKFKTLKEEIDKLDISYLQFIKEEVVIALFSISKMIIE